MLQHFAECQQRASKCHNMQANIENSAVAQGWKSLVFIPVPKKDKPKEYSNYLTIALISHTSKVMLNFFQLRLQQYMNCELPAVQSWFRKGKGTRDQITNLPWIIDKAREFQKKNIYFCIIDYVKASDCVDNNKLWKILQEMDIPDHLTCILRNLYAGQEATVRTKLGTMDWFQIVKGLHQRCIVTVAKCQTEWRLSCNQDCQEKYQ